MKFTYLYYFSNVFISTKNSTKHIQVISKHLYSPNFCLNNKLLQGDNKMKNNDYEGFELYMYSNNNENKLDIFKLNAGLLLYILMYL